MTFSLTQGKQESYWTSHWALSVMQTCNCLPALIKGAFDWSYSGIRLRHICQKSLLPWFWTTLWRGILYKNVIGSYHKVHYIEFACILSYRTRYAVMSYSVMLYCNRNTVLSYSVTLYRNQNSIVSYPVVIYRNLYAVVSYSVTWYRNLNDVVSYPVTIDCIQEIVMSYTAAVYYSRDAVMSYPIALCRSFLSSRTRWKCGHRLSKQPRSHAGSLSLRKDG